MAALNPTAGMAQDAPRAAFDMPAPLPVVSPTPMPVKAPAPVVVAASPQPLLAVELPAPTPLVEPPVVAQAEPVATTQTTRRVVPVVQDQDPTTRRSGRSQAVAPSNEAAAEPLADIVATQTAPTSIAEPVATTEPAAIAAPAGDASSADLWLGLLGLGGIGFAGFLAFRTRRRRREDAVPLIERPLLVERARPAPKPAPGAVEFDVPPLGPPRQRAPVPNDGAAVDLPSKLPESGAARARLLQRMIAAKPDRANPFASPKARAKRARLILQSIGTHFTDRKPGIDLSQYTHVWPELRGWRPANA